MSTAIYEISPSEDPRWAAYLARNADASLFHSAAWLEALRETYGFQPVVFTTASPADRLENGVVCCRVVSRVTGCRLVSVPFSDCCQPLADDPRSLTAVLSALEHEIFSRRWRYLELRQVAPLELASPGWHTSARYLQHQIDLRPDLAELFNRLHKDSTQRKVRRAEREGLTHRSGASDAMLDDFYRLLTASRRRHGVPPQPKRWFESLIHYFGDDLQIRLAMKGDRPVAGMLTIRYKNTLTYKYGGSDAAYHPLGAMHLLYWSAIQDAKRWGLSVFDLGRTDATQSGLVTFKRRWGATEGSIVYSRYVNPTSHGLELARAGWKTRAAQYVFARSPSPVLSLLGNLFYRHFG